MAGRAVVQLLFISSLLLSTHASDNFQEATALENNVAAISSLANATSQSGEPLSNNGKGKTVWWKWIPFHDGLALFSFEGTRFPPILSVFTGATLQTLRRIPVQEISSVPAKEDCFQPSIWDLDSYLHLTRWAFPARAQQLYFIQIDAALFFEWFPTGDIDESVLQIQVELPAPPSNDNFANSIPLSGESFDFAGSFRGAGLQPGELLPDSAVGRSVWFTWTPPHTGMCKLTSLTNPLRLLTVWQGSSLTNLVPVRTNATLQVLGDGGRWSTRTNLFFNAAASEPLHFQIDLINRFLADDFQFHLELLTPPPNDNFADATPLAGTALSLTNSTRGATREPNEPNHGINGGSSVWYRWRSSAAGSLTVTTNDAITYSAASVTNYPSLFDLTTTVPIIVDENQKGDPIKPLPGCNWYEVDPDIFFPAFAIYQGASLDSLTQLAAGGNVITIVSAGTDYFIAADANHGLPGDFKMSLAFNPLPPNDHFTDSIPITGGHVEVTSYTVGASADPSEPAHVDAPAQHSVWWSWSAPGTGPVSVSAAPPLTVAVYTGNSLETLQPITASTNATQTFRAQRGVTYQIVADTLDGITGAVRLELEMSPPNEYLARPLEQSSGTFKFYVHDVAGDTISIQYSFDLLDWHEISLFQLQADVTSFIVSTSRSESHLFYRAIPHQN